MKRFRYCLLIAALAFLFNPLKFITSADQSRWFDSDGDEVSMFGNVRVRGTPSGHITVAVDKALAFGEVQPDGVWDVVFHFAPKKTKPQYRDIVFDLENATLVSTGRRLTVLSSDRQIVLNLSLEREARTYDWTPYYDDRSRDLPNTVRIGHGQALGQYQSTMKSADKLWSCGAEDGTCSIVKKVGRIRTADEGDPDPPADCPAGGPGATECGIQCGGGQGCSVSCGPGTYACCHCTNGCHCIKNST